MTGRQTMGFLALCVWSSVGWLTEDLLPVGWDSAVGAGLRLVLMGLGGAAVALALGRRFAWGVLGTIACMGLLMVGLPVLLLDRARGMAAPSLGVVVFALVPIVVMIVEDKMRRLIWGLCGVAGLLLLLPVGLPASGRGLLGTGLLLAAAGVTAGGLFGMRRLVQGVGVAEALAAVGLGSGLLLVAVGMMSGPVPWSWDGVEGELARAVLIDLPQTVLLVWLVRDISLLQFSARYLVTPLLTVVEGWAVVRAGMDARMAVGVALVGGGAYGLLRATEEGEETRLGLS